MPPFAEGLTHAAKQLLARNALSSPSEVKRQWRNPGNIVDILLLVGSDVVHTAIAQLSGSGWPTPVVFSFGWLAYSFAALVSVIGDKRLMPAPDVPSIVINASTGYARENHSWVLGRLLRDFEDGYWMDPEIKRQLKDMLDLPATTSSLKDGKVSVTSTPSKPPKRRKKGLCISIYEADPVREATDVVLDPIFYLGYAVAIFQMVIAALPWMIWGNGNYITFALTVGGNLLSFSMSSLPQWRRERFSSRPRTRNDCILTRGNGSQHALVILGRNRGLNLEDLATSSHSNYATWTTQLLVVLFSLLWVALLITVDGLRENTWFLVAVGGLGSVYSIVAAGLARRPEHLGIPLKWTKRCIVNETVMVALMEAEKYQSGLGRAMLETFFPGARSAKEEAFWESAKKMHLLKNPPPTKQKIEEQVAKMTEEFDKEFGMLQSQNGQAP